MFYYLYFYKNKKYNYQSRTSLIINSIKKNIMNNKNISKYFNFTYTSQKYDIEYILIKILKVIKYGIPWRLIETIPYTTVYTVGLFGFALLLFEK